MWRNSVHGAKTAKGEELVWRKFLTVLYNQIAEKRGGEKGVFLQIDFSVIDISKLPKYSIPFEILKKQLSQIAITETHAETGGKIKTWKLDNKYFDYAHFLRQATMAVASERGAHILTSKMADITGIIDEYVSKYIFGGEIDSVSLQLAGRQARNNRIRYFISYKR